MRTVSAGNRRDLPYGWRWASMGDIAEVVGGGTPRTSEPANFDSGDIPWITLADLSGYREKYISHGGRFITRRGLESSAAQLLPAGTVLFSSRAPIGYVAIARNSIATNQGFKSFVLKDGVLPEYVYWWLKGSKTTAESLASGTTFLEISGVNAKKIPILIAPLDQQHKIVAEIEKQLSRLDEVVTDLRRVRKNLTRYRASVVDAACDGTLGRDGAYLSPVPFTTLGDLASAGGYGTSVKCSYENAGIPVLRIPNIVKGRVDLGDLKSAPETYRATEEDQLAPGDLLVIRTNGSKHLIGRGAIIFDRLPSAHAFASYLIRFRLSGGPDLWRWIRLVLERLKTRRWIERHAASSAGQHNVSLTLLRSLPIPLPDEATRLLMIREVEHRFSIIENAERQVEAGLQRAERYRLAILTRTFRP